MKGNSTCASASTMPVSVCMRTKSRPFSPSASARLGRAAPRPISTIQPKVRITTLTMSGVMTSSPSQSAVLPPARAMM
jgi:hypothetical protein